MPFRSVHSPLAFFCALLVVLIGFQEAFHTHDSLAQSATEVAWRGHDCAGVGRHGSLPKDAVCGICLRSSKEFVAASVFNPGEEVPLALCRASGAERPAAARTVGPISDRAPPARASV